MSTLTKYELKGAVVYSWSVIPYPVHHPGILVRERAHRAPRVPLRVDRPDLPLRHHMERHHRHHRRRGALIYDVDIEWVVH